MKDTEMPKSKQTELKEALNDLTQLILAKMSLENVHETTDIIYSIKNKINEAIRDQIVSQQELLI